MLDQTAENQVKKVLKAIIEEKDIAGANLLVIKDGEEIFYHEDGWANREAAQPIKRDSIFRLYSMSKPVTATAVMILLERGELDLYDPVSKYLEGFQHQKVEVEGKLVPAHRDMNLKDLLSMTSGLVYGGNHQAGKETSELFQEIDQRLLGDAPLGTVEAMNKLGKAPLAFQPGTSWEYGSSADVLGAVVEVVSGKRFGEFLETELFQPLGMQDTAFWVPEEKRDRLARTYARNGQELIVYTGNHLGIINEMDRPPAFESGGAGLVSTIDDYAQFAKMLLNKGQLDGTQILRPRTVNYLTSATLSSAQQINFENWHTLSGHSYGNLMRVMTDVSRGGFREPGRIWMGRLAWRLFC